MSVVKRKTKTVVLSETESITICELSIGEYQYNLAELTMKHGTSTTMSDFVNRNFTVEVADILMRMNFRYIIEWTLKDGNGKKLELTYPNYEHLPHRVGSMVADAIHDFEEEQ